MHYFKHAELVEKYRVSLKTIHNWIDSAKNKKINLELYVRNGRTYIADTPENLTVLTELAHQGKKYRNNLHHKTITPIDKFYDTYSRQQILDIITNLSVHHESPVQYSYFEEGAIYWDKYTKRMAQDVELNVLKATEELIQMNKTTIDHLLAEYDRVNVIDIGCGNGLAVRGLLDHLVARDKLNRYIGLDISKKMLRIAESNIQEWFGDKVRFEGHIKDITHERFDDLIVDDMLAKGSEKIVNIAVFFGCTIMNFRRPYDVLKVIYDSLGQEDLMIYVEKLDSEAARRYLNFGDKSGAILAVSPRDGMMLELLGIDESLYDVEMGYNDQKRMRYVRIRFKLAVTIKFEHEGIDREVKFDKGDSVLLLRIWHQNAHEIIESFQDVGLTLLHSSLTRNRQYLLTVSGVDLKDES